MLQLGVNGGTELNLACLGAPIEKLEALLNHVIVTKLCKNDMIEEGLQLLDWSPQADQIQFSASIYS